MKRFLKKLGISVFLLFILFAININFPLTAFASWGKVPNTEKIAIRLTVSPYPSSSESMAIMDSLPEKIEAKLINAGFKIIKMKRDVIYLDIRIEFDKENENVDQRDCSISAECRINKCLDSQNSIAGSRSLWGYNSSDLKNYNVDTITDEVLNAVQKFIDESMRTKKRNEKLRADEQG